MAEFGPKVFHALGMYADKMRNNKFETSTAKDVGLLEVDKSGAGLNPDQQIERVKNALFKMMMLRARNTMQLLGEEKTKSLIGPGNRGIPVSMTVYFNDTAIHPTDGLNEKEIEDVKVFLMRVRGISIDPFVFDTEDIKETRSEFETLSMACGSYPLLDSAHKFKLSESGAATTEEDPMYTDLWGG